MTGTAFDIAGRFEDPNPKVRCSAVQELGQLGREGDAIARLQLVERLDEDVSAEVRASAAIELGSMNERGAAPALINGLGDPDRIVRFCSAQSLGKMSRYITKCMQSKKEKVREHAANIIINEGREIEKALITASENENDSMVLAAVARSLGELGFIHCAIALNRMFVEREDASKTDGLESRERYVMIMAKEALEKITADSGSYDKDKKDGLEGNAEFRDINIVHGGKRLVSPIPTPRARFPSRDITRVIDAPKQPKAKIKLPVR